MSRTGTLARKLLLFTQAGTFGGKMQVSRKIRSLIRASALAFAFASSTAHAADLTSYGVIDTIDFVFGAGGGLFNGAALSGTDDSWLVFGANTSDNIVINFSSVSSPSSLMEAVVFIDIGDGNIQVGDAMNLTNFNIIQFGQGNPLQVFNAGGEILGSRYLVWDPSFNDASFVAPFTGQYGIALTSENSFTRASYAYSVTLSGNTLNLVPEPSTLAIFVLGLAGLGFMRRRRRVV